MREGVPFTIYINYIIEFLRVQLYKGCSGERRKLSILTDSADYDNDKATLRFDNIIPNDYAGYGYKLACAKVNGSSLDDASFDSESDYTYFGISSGSVVFYRFHQYDRFRTDLSLCNHGV